MKHTKAFEQEPVSVASGIRELSVGARQLLDLGEFLLQAAGLKFKACLIYGGKASRPCRERPLYLVSVSALDEAFFARKGQSRVVARPQRVAPAFFQVGKTLFLLQSSGINSLRV